MRGSRVIEVLNVSGLMTLAVVRGGGGWPLDAAWSWGGGGGGGG